MPDKLPNKKELLEQLAEIRKEAAAVSAAQAAKSAEVALAEASASASATPAPAEPAAKPENKNEKEGKLTPAQEVEKFVEEFDLKDLLPKEFAGLTPEQKLLTIKDVQRRIVDIVKTDAQTQYSDYLKSKMSTSAGGTNKFTKALSGIWAGTQNIGTTLLEGARKQTKLKNLESDTFKKLRASDDGKLQIATDLEQLAKRNAGREVLLDKEGKPYAGISAKTLNIDWDQATMSEKADIEEFQQKAAAFRNMPYEWGQEEKAFIGGNKKKYEEAREEYEEARSNILKIKTRLEEKAGLPKGKAMTEVLQMDNALKLDQILNTHPEFEQTILDLEKTAGGKEYLKSAGNFLETIMGGKNHKNKLAFALGFSTRAVTKYGVAALGGTLATAIGAVAAPIIGGAFGAWRGKIRAKETLKTKSKEARRGDSNTVTGAMAAELAKLKISLAEAEKNKDKKAIKELKKNIENIEDQKKAKLEKGNIVDVTHLSKRLEDLITEVKNSSNTREQTAKALSALAVRIEHSQGKIELGQVNFGDAKSYLNNQFNFLNKLNEAMVLEASWSPGVDKDTSDRINKLLSSRSKEIKQDTDEARDAFIKKQIKRGALMGAGFAAAGYGVRMLGEHFGWWGDYAAKAAEATDTEATLEEIPKALAPEGTRLDAYASPVFVKDGEWLYVGADGDTIAPSAEDVKDFNKQWLEQDSLARAKIAQEFFKADTTATVDTVNTTPIDTGTTVLDTAKIDTGVVKLDTAAAIDTVKITPPLDTASIDTVTTPLDTNIADTGTAKLDTIKIDTIATDTIKTKLDTLKNSILDTLTNKKVELNADSIAKLKEVFSAEDLAKIEKDSLANILKLQTDSLNKLIGINIDSVEAIAGLDSAQAENFLKNIDPNLLAKIDSNQIAEWAKLPTDSLKQASGLDSATVASFAGLTKAELVKAIEHAQKALELKEQALEVVTKVEKGVEVEFSVALGKDHVPPNLETVFNEISADYMDLPASGEIDEEFATKSLNMAANLVKLTEGKGVAGIDAKEFAEAASYKNGILEIKDHIKFNEALEKLQDHSDKQWDAGVLQGKGAAITYIPKISKEGWLKIAHADGMHDVGDVSTGIEGHQEIKLENIKDFDKSELVQKAIVPPTTWPPAEDILKYDHLYKIPVIEPRGDGWRGVAEYASTNATPPSDAAQTADQILKEKLEQTRLAEEAAKQNTPPNTNTPPENTGAGVSKEDPYDLSEKDLAKVDKLYDKNIGKIFDNSREENIWNNIKNSHEAKLSPHSFLSMKTAEIEEKEPAVQQFISYLHKLYKVTGVKPILETPLTQGETNAEYIKRALQKASEMDVLDKVKV